MNQSVSVKTCRPDARIPVYSSAAAAGADLFACLEAPVTIAPGETALLPTGLAMEIPAGFAGLIFARSGLATRQGLAPANKVGVVDADYRGEVLVSLHNHGTVPQTVEHGERIAQLVIVPFLTAQFTVRETLSETARGAGGFGSTGRK